MLRCCASRAGESPDAGSLQPLHPQGRHAAQPDRDVADDHVPVGRRPDGRLPRHADGVARAGGFGLVFPEQIAITPDGRTGTSCAGIYDDGQIEGLSRVTAIIKDMGAVPGIQLGHTGRKGSEKKPWHGKTQLPPDHPDGWQVRGPSAITYGGRYTFPVHALAVDEIEEIHRAYAQAARRALDAGFEWLEMHFAHGYLGASFFSPLANRRTDEYGGNLENRLRFHREALDAVRAVWPERLPLTMRLGSDDFHEEGVRFDDAVWAVGVLKGTGSTWPTSASA
jgi:2,4-dienoyl-CoA reductase-like NADH-dependent reductase (Old Yellow Enzyme family)